MNNNNGFSLRQTIPVMAMVLTLSACDTFDGFLRKDNVSPTAMIKSSGQAPAKAEAVRQREQQVQALLVQAEAAYASGDLAGAEQAYQALLALEPGNLRASEGLQHVDARQRHQAMNEEARKLIGRSEADDEQAAVILRSVLAEDPYDHQARGLYQELTSRQSARRAEALRKRLTYSTPMTLEFRDVPIKMLIEALSRGTGVSIILDKDVRSDQRATLFVKNVELESALDLLAQTNQLQKKVLNERSVILYPNTVIKMREYQELVIRSFYLEYADPKVVGASLKTMLGVKQVQMDERLPMIMIKDVPEIMVLAEKLIASQDLPDPEVMLELEVIEIKRNRTLDAGVTWPNTLTVVGPTNQTGTRLPLTLEGLRGFGSSDVLVSPNPALVLGATNADANLLANPRIRVKNKEKARIHIGDRVPVITSIVSSTGVSTENVQYIDVGLRLEAEPLISIGGDVTLKLNLDVGSLGQQFTTRNGAVVFQIGTRSTSTQLRLKDGETQVLAGLISDEDRRNVAKVPGLGDIPLLGRLFSNRGDAKFKTEIVLSVTPRIVRERRTMPAGVAEFWSGTEAQAGRNMAMPTAVSDSSQVPNAVPVPAATPPSYKPYDLNMPLPPGLGKPVEDELSKKPEANE